MEDILSVFEIQSSRLNTFLTGGSALKDPVVKTIEKWWQAWCRGDLATIDELTGEAYMCLTRRGELRIQGKPALMATVPKLAGVCPDVSWTVREPSLERLNGAFICSYKLGFVTSLGRRGLAVVDGMTDVLIQEDGQWLIVAHHGDLSFPMMPKFNPLVLLSKGDRPGDRQGASWIGCLGAQDAPRSA
jgi:hypothetical protein